MSPRDTSNEERKVKTLAIRLDPELHAQLSVIAQLSGSTITDEIREALHVHVANKAFNGDLAGAATEMLEEIEREAAVRRDALSGLLSQSDTTTNKPARTRGRKPSDPDVSADS